MFRKSTMIALVLALVLALFLVAGCGGGGGDSSPMTPPAPPAFAPTVHGGYAVYLIGGQWDSSYIPQSSPDSFSVAPGCYKPVCLKVSEIGTMGVKPQGGIDWTASFTRKGSSELVSPTPNGWVFGPGTYSGTITNPAGGTISFKVKVVAADLGGLKVKMVAVKATGNAFPKATSGYQIPVFTPYRWSQVWTKGGIVVAKPDRYSASASTLSGSENLEWIDGGNQGKVVGVTTFAVIVYDNTDTPGEGGGGVSVTVDTVAISFTPGGFDPGGKG